MTREVKDLVDWASVNRLYKKDPNISKIARDTGFSRNTIRKLINMKEEPKYERTTYATKVDPFKDQIKEWYLSPVFAYNGTRIIRELRKQGYTGSTSPVYRYLKTLGTHTSKISPKATVRIETPYGEQAQFDWSEYYVYIDGVNTKVYCFLMILSASRKKAITFSLTVDADAIYESICELFSEFGGVTQELLIDNPKALVIHNDVKKNEPPQLNASAMLMAAHLGTELNPCNCYRARTKGKVEKPFQYIEEQFIKGNTFTSMYELTKQGKAFLDEWNNTIHGTTKKVPSLDFIHERENLLPFPQNKFFHTLPESRKVSNDSFVHFKACKYSVPVKYVEHTIKVRLVYGYIVEIYTLQNELILCHELAPQKGMVKAVSEHYKDIAPSAAKSIPELKRCFTQKYSCGQEFIEKAYKVLQQPMYHIRKILELSESCPEELLEIVLMTCIDQNQFEVSKVKEVIKESYTSSVVIKEPSSETVMEESIITRDCDYYERRFSGATEGNK